jgi:hypothetical protein
MFAGLGAIVSFPAFSLIYIPKEGVTTERNPNVSWKLIILNGKSFHERD